MSGLERPRVSREAVAGCLLGVASVFLLLNAITGIPAIVLGVRALVRIEREGPENLGGRKLAFWAFTLGALGTLMGPVLIPPAVQAVREEMSREAARANLEQIGAAINAYEASGSGRESGGKRLASPPALR